MSNTTIEPTLLMIENVPEKNISPFTTATAQLANDQPRLTTH